jgi:hypothetical protein
VALYVCRNYKLYDCPVAINDNSDYFAFSVWRCFSPPILVCLIGFGAYLHFASCNIFELAVVWDKGCAPVGITQIPALMPHSYCPFSFIHIVLSVWLVSIFEMRDLRDRTIQRLISGAFEVIAV